MSDQSDNLNFFLFVSVIISDVYFFKEIVLLNTYFLFSKKLILSVIHKVTTGT